MRLVYKKGEGLVIIESTFCCDYLKELVDGDDLAFSIVTDDRYDIVKKDWIRSSTPYTALTYKSPGYYGDVDTEYEAINFCPKCGAKLSIYQKTLEVDGS